jgi:hypothetical protein
MQKINNTDNKKKQPRELTTTDYKRAGKILLPFGVVMVLLWVLGYFMAWEFTPSALLYIGLLDIVVSCFLIFLMPNKP